MAVLLLLSVYKRLRSRSAWCLFDILQALRVSGFVRAVVAMQNRDMQGWMEVASVAAILEVELESTDRVRGCVMQMASALESGDVQAPSC